MDRTPLEPWIFNKITGDLGTTGKLTRAQLEKYQLQKIQETFQLAKGKSSFYRGHLAGIDGITGLKDIEQIPFTTAENIRENPLRFLCVSQSEINRIVTLQSSGTTGLPKRLYFTRDDQELMMDFFHQGMSTLVKSGDRVLILLPVELPDSVGDLLVRGLQRLGVTGIPHGPVRDVKHTIKVMVEEKVNCLVGIPLQVFSLARQMNLEGTRFQLKSVLLSTDHVPQAIVEELQNTWNCKVFNHYGMTEMGLGGGVDCQALAGYHMREADLYFEIVDPLTGEKIPDGSYGEVVFTTLTRRGMPLIRYRTGDMSRFIPEPCPCGSLLKRMEHVKYRLASRVFLNAGDFITMADLDEVILRYKGIVSFTASLKKQNNQQILNLLLQVNNQAQLENNKLIDSIRLALTEIPALKRCWQKQLLLLKIELTQNVVYSTNGTGKRIISNCAHKSMSDK